MQNNEIFEKLKNELIEIHPARIADILSTLYDIKFNAAKTIEESEEYDYERQWWMNKNLELIELNK